MAKPFKSILFRDLKNAGLGHIIPAIVSVRTESYSGGSSLNITVLDLNKPDREELEDFRFRYAYGSFDGMTDCYNVDNRRDDVERQFKYVFVNARYSPAVEERALEITKETYGVDSDDDAQKKHGVWLDMLVYRVLNGSHKGFMDQSLRGTK